MDEGWAGKEPEGEGVSDPRGEEGAPTEEDTERETNRYKEERGAFLRQLGFEKASDLPPSEDKKLGCTLKNKNKTRQKPCLLRPASELYKR